MKLLCWLLAATSPILAQVGSSTLLGDVRDASGAMLTRVVVQVIPGEQFQAERDLRRLIKKRFDEMGVEIPFPRRTVYVKHDGGGMGPDEAAAGAVRAGPHVPVPHPVGRQRGQSKRQDESKSQALLGLFQTSARIIPKCLI